MKTYFAPAERAKEHELLNDIERITNNPVINGLMNFASGLFAVLNEHRQILTLNESFLNMLGVDDVKQVLGLRPGESIQCIHATELVGGCGTSEFCSTCGAAIAIVTSLTKNQTVERKCAITINKNDKEFDIFLNVRSCPLSFNERRFILIFLQDITKEQQWSTLEQVFFHDISNLVFGILGRSELLLSEEGMNENRLARQIYRLSSRLSNEIAIQKQLFRSGMGVYRPIYTKIPVSRVFQEMKNEFSNHELTKNRSIKYPEILPDVSLKTDFSLLIRILDNMVINALEASQDHEEVRLFLDSDQESVAFCVWNRASIPEDISKRIFQRNFSTREGIGRGLGTYSMKFFGEEVLGGRVSFTTSKDKGTTFRMRFGL